MIIQIVIMKTLMTQMYIMKTFHRNTEAGPNVGIWPVAFI
jgi:hypothetical protein